MAATRKTEIRRDTTTMKWRCPECDAPANDHGKGGHDKCDDRMGGSSQCQGFICECAEETAPAHGTTMKDRCPAARCYHCGWEGTFPQMPKKVAPWEKKALEAGWQPPSKRAKELGFAGRDD